MDSSSIYEPDDMDAEDAPGPSSLNTSTESIKPKRNRKSTQRLLETFLDEDTPSFLQKKKKKSTTPKKKEGQGEESGKDDGDPSGIHNEQEQMTDKQKDRVQKFREARASATPCHNVEVKGGKGCKQKAIIGYTYCIWHILMDKNAPYKLCEHMKPDTKGTGTEMLQCKTAIRNDTVPPLCTVHSGIKKKNKKRNKDTSMNEGDDSVDDKMEESPLPSTLNQTPHSSHSSLFNINNHDDDPFPFDIEEAIETAHTVLGVPRHINSLIDSVLDNPMNSFDDLSRHLDDNSSFNILDGDMSHDMDTSQDGIKTSMEKELLYHLINRPFEIGKEILSRNKEMREAKDMNEFWKIASSYDAPKTRKEYNDTYGMENLLLKSCVSPLIKEEMRILLNDDNCQLYKELNLLHEYNKSLLDEGETLQWSVINGMNN